MHYVATTSCLELTELELRDTTGRRIVAVADIRGVDRGALAFKPSQGFLIRTHAPQPRGWAPGLWWRLGRSVGIGGVTRAGEGKYMAETLQALLDSRGA